MPFWQNVRNSSSARTTLAVGCVLLAVGIGMYLQPFPSQSLDEEHHLWNRASAYLMEGVPHTRSEGRLDIATRIIENPASGPDQKALAYLDRASIYYLTFRSQAARRDLDAAASLRPLEKDTLVGVYDIRGEFSQSRWQYDAARSDFDAALALNPDDLAARVCRGINYRRTDDFSQAIADLDHALRWLPKWHAEVEAQIKQLSRYGSEPFVPKFVVRFERSYHEITGKVLAQRAVTYRRAGRYDKAIADYSAAIQAIPENANLFSGRAAAYFLAHDWALAADDQAYSINLSFSDWKPRPLRHYTVCEI